MAHGVPRHFPGLVYFFSNLFCFISDRVPMILVKGWERPSI